MVELECCFPHDKKSCTSTSTGMDDVIQLFARRSLPEYAMNLPDLHDLLVLTCVLSCSGIWTLLSPRCKVSLYSDTVARDRRDTM